MTQQPSRNVLIAQTLQSLTMAEIRLKKLGLTKDSKVVRDIHDRLSAAYHRSAA